MGLQSRSSYLGTEMKEDQQRFLSLMGRLPARLNVEQTAWALNCRPHDVPVLVAEHLLKPLGSPTPNGTKFFATADILEAITDRGWLVKITNCVSRHWQKKNKRKRVGNASVYNDIISRCVNSPLAGSA
jgi:hypothetical protein